VSPDVTESLRATQTDAAQGAEEADSPAGFGSEYHDRFVASECEQ
jgi:hypothetical protein